MTSGCLRMSCVCMHFQNRPALTQRTYSVTQMGSLDVKIKVDVILYSLRPETLKAAEAHTQQASVYLQ